MNAPNAGNDAIGRQFGVLALGKHAILKLDLAIVEQQLEPVACKQTLLLAIALVILLRPALFDPLNLCG